MVNWELLSWVLEGSQRIAILRIMETPMTPSLIHKKRNESHQKTSINSTSMVLRSFVRAGLAKCTNQVAKRRRIYKLTKTGMTVREELLKIMTTPMTKIQLSRKMNEQDEKTVSFSTVSVVLKEFMKVGLVVCVNPKRLRGRIYKLTEEGGKIRNLLANMQ